MAKTVWKVTLEIVLCPEDNECLGDPRHWDWPELLDMNNDEVQAVDSYSVRIEDED